MDQQKKMIVAQEIFEEREKMFVWIKPHISARLQALIMKKIGAEKDAFLATIQAESRAPEIPKTLAQQENLALSKNFFIKKPLIL